MDENPLQRRPRLIRNCRLSDSPDQPNILLMPEGVMRIKGMGAEILKLCDGERTLDDILKHLQKQFPKTEPEKIAAESMHFLEQLREKRVMDF